ncbi:Mus7/MMS22 family-domain-containing protein, partial [Delphinella strobiligena]
MRLDDSDDENGFPDTDVALNRHVLGGLQNGYKRRKTNETPHAPGLLQDLPSSTAGTRGKLRSLGLISRTASLSGIPLSPPRTSSPSIAEAAASAIPQFRLPRGFTPPHIESSVQSSPSKRKEAAPRFLTLSDSDSENATSSERTSSPDPEAEQERLRREAKRIKGVLPASWLMLDRKTQRTTSILVPGNAEYTPKPTEPVRGVAQRVNSYNRNTPAGNRASIVLSDDSDASDTSLRELPAAHIVNLKSRPPRQSHLKQFDDTGDVEEYDEIDRMAPAARRPHLRKDKSSKQQARLTDAFVRPTGGLQSARRVASEPKPDRTGSGFAASHRAKQKPNAKGKSKRQRKRPAKLSILDAAQEDDHISKPRPDFLRLAARQARKRPDLGRHSPTRKAIRLATHDDTQDALVPLRSWSAGNLHPSALVDLTADDEGSPDRASLSTSRTIRRVLKQTRLKADHRPETENAAWDDTRRPSARPRSERQHANLGRIRPGQLETSTRRLDHDRDLLTFAPPPSRLLEIFRRDRVDGAASRFRLERFLQDKGGQDNNEDVNDTVMTDADGGATANSSTIPKRSRKRLARRLDVELRTFRQPSEPLPAESEPIPLGPISVAADAATLLGLGPFGTRYPTDFDVRPLEIGTYFPSSSFIGSGDFADSLTLRNRDLNIPAGHISIELGGQSLHWSAWNEDVSTGLNAVLCTTTDGLKALIDAASHEDRCTMFTDVSTCADYLLRSVVRYLTGCLHFIDPVDRFPCVTRLSRFLDEVCETLQEQMSKLSSFHESKAQTDRLFIDLLLYVLCISVQTVRIAQHHAVGSGLQMELVEKTIKISRRIVALSLPGRFTSIRWFLENHRKHAFRDAGIQDDQVAVRCVVIVNHALQSVPTSKKLSDLIFAQLDGVLETSCNVQSLDQVWYDIFTMQPLLEIDDHGIFIPGTRFQSSNDNWSLVKTLLQRLFLLYPASARSRCPTLNDFVRACFSRAYYLITRWGWRKCESLLNTVYDFFATNGLSQLHNEESKGSPHFLEELNKKPVIHLEDGDCAFHIFLKLLVVGLQGMRTVYLPKKVKGIAYRFLPNHGRTYRKDQEITQADLDALRNNHDLLCTLYWVLPRGDGPRLQMIINLVDHANSHREACRLSVHAWGVIAKYQLSSGERFSDLDTLASWFKDMASTTMSQYRLARSEAEVQFAAERAKGSTDITHEMVEMTIASNQRGILAILLDLLQALQRAVRVSRCWDVSRDLTNLADMIDTFKLFDPDQPRLFAAILQALNIISDLHQARPVPQITDSQQESEESQDYGDWSYLEEAADADVEASTASVNNGLEFLHEPLASLLSSCFGSDKAPDDDLLKTVVSSWTLVVSDHVKHKVHDWSSYLDTYNTNSWFQLRNTDQRRKYTPYFLSSIIDADITALRDHRPVFLGTWLVSLLERESMLKFQHLLTSALLNGLRDDPLLHNLPFATNSRTGRFDITMTDLRERRISLIDCILSNMHLTISINIAPKSTMAADLRREYSEILRQAMAFMRRNYEELRDASSAAGESHTFVQGAYVSFVQHMISLMQQYTVDICPIDRFFVDSSVFPLPSNDPTYVVGRLKSYVFKLGESRSRKQLAVFMQTVSERAAVDNEQEYLISQLHQAMTGQSSDSLRSVMMIAIFPAYLEAAQSTTSGWIMALPLIEATGLVFEDLRYHLDMANNIDTNLATITAMLQTLFKWTLHLTLDPSLLAQAQNVHMLNASFRAVQSSFTIVDYVSRRIGKGQDAVKLVQLFVIMGRHFLQAMRGDLDLVFPEIVDIPEATPQQYPDTEQYSKRELFGELKCWVKRGDDYQVIRGNNVRDITVDIGLVEEEQESASLIIEEFLQAYDMIFRRIRNLEGTVSTEEL